MSVWKAMHTTKAIYSNTTGSFLQHQCCKREPPVSPEFSDLNGIGVVGNWIGGCIRRYSRSSVSNLSNHHAVTTDRNGEVVICWHPEKKFPYEHSKAIPRDENSLKMGTSETKLKELNFRDPRGPKTHELNQMFHVTKHTWRPRPQINRAKKTTPQERKAL